MDGVVLKALKAQLESMWKMVKDAIAKVPDAKWNSGAEGDFFVPGRLLLHTIEAVDYYFDWSPKTFKWGRHGDWEKCRNDEIIPKSSLREYCSEIEGKMAEWLGKLGELGCDSEDTTFRTDWNGNIERALYALRHTQHHIGQLSHKLQAEGFEEISWV